MKKTSVRVCWEGSWDTEKRCVCRAAAAGLVGPTPGCHSYAMTRATWPFTLGNGNQ